MTAQGRAWLAALALLLATTCAIIGAVINDESLKVMGTSAITLVLGYAFGDRNGERRLSNALAEHGLNPAVNRALRIDPTSETEQ